MRVALLDEEVHETAGRGLEYESLVDGEVYETAIDQVGTQECPG